ncbi:MAG: porin family protein [Paludibacteraceae bacterium]|nr:porin family protein [Paludibacteraceae bacterium]
MKHIFHILMALAMVPILALAETKESRAAHPHELSFGLGESFVIGAFGRHYEHEHVTENNMFPPLGTSVPEANQMLNQKFDHLLHSHTLPHFYLDYQYRILPWLGLGAQTDFLGTTALYERRNGYGDTFGQLHSSNLMMSVVPTLRFTYLHRDWVNLYSGGGAGYAIMLSMEDGRVINVLHSPAFQVTALGLSVGRDHWFGSAELGIMLRPAFGHFFDRFFSAAVGYRF